MATRRPTPRRPPLSAPRGQLRAAYRLAGGMSPARLARVEAVAEREIDALLAQLDFQELPAALVEMEELSEEERLRRLERLAWHVLELALADSDWRAAASSPTRCATAATPPARWPKRDAAQARAAAPPPAEPKPVRPRRARPYDAVEPPWAVLPRACARSWASRPPWPTCPSPRRPSRSRARPRPSRPRPRANSPPGAAAPMPSRPASAPAPPPAGGRRRQRPARPIARLGARAIAGGTATTLATWEARSRRCGASPTLQWTVAPRRSWRVFQGCARGEEREVPTQRPPHLGPAGLAQEFRQAVLGGAPIGALHLHLDEIGPVRPGLVEHEAGRVVGDPGAAPR